MSVLGLGAVMTHFFLVIDQPEAIDYGKVGELESIGKGVVGATLRSKVEESIGGADYVGEI